MDPRRTRPRREFLRRTLRAGAGLALAPRLDSLAAAADRAVARIPDDGSLRETFPDLEQGFRRLTALYDDVRYGNRRPTGEEVRTATPQIRAVLARLRHPG